MSDDPFEIFELEEVEVVHVPEVQPAPCDVSLTYEEALILIRWLTIVPPLVREEYRVTYLTVDLGELFAKLPCAVVFDLEDMWRECADLRWAKMVDGLMNTLDRIGAMAAGISGLKDGE